MKSVLVIGLGRFGRHIAQRMMELGNDVMVVDKNEELVEQYSPEFTDSLIGDCRNEAVLRSLGVSNFDICIVAIGEDFQASLEITSLLKELGAKFVVSKANRDRQAKFLMKIGADEVIYPEKETAEKLAVRYNAKNIFDFIELTPEYSIYEIPILPAWAGRSISELNIRRKYHINIIAVKNSGNRLKPLPGPDYVFDADDHVVVIGRAGDVFKLSART
jgi:trk system potassium uptake protein TrkA